MEVFVFSYNRGRFLQNCLNSMETCLPKGIRKTIVDDGSTDEETVAVLRQAEVAGVRVIRVQDRTAARHGGLYGNLQRAIDEWSTEDFVLFIQDDTQVVRELDDQDLDYIRGYFNQFEHAAFLFPGFINMNSRPQISAAALSGQFPAYFVANERPQSWYSDIVIAHRGRLVASEFRFGPTENETGKTAKGLFSQMGHMANPFVAWLPFVPNYRGRRETLSMRLTKVFGIVGYFPFEVLSQDQVRTLKSRDIAELPIAENFLTPQGLGAERKPWYHNPVSQMRWLRSVQRVGVRIGRRLRKRS